MKKHLTASTLILCAALTSHAHAQCTSVYRFGVPDFDQKRLGLLNNGSMHCVPTSAINWMAYAVNHGLDNAMGYASSNWADPSNYFHVTQRISSMGVYMDTDSGGTTLSGGIDGLIEYFDGYNIPAGFIFLGYAADGDWAPTPTLMRHHLAAGHLVNFCFGRYDLDGDQWERDGGHCMSVVRVVNPCSSSPTLGFHNPSTSSDDSTLSQSSFTMGTWQLTSSLRNMDGEWRVMWEPTGQDGETNNRRFIDKLVVMQPFYGWTAPPALTSIIKLRPWILNNVLEPNDANIPSPSGTPINGLCSNIRFPGFFASTIEGRFAPAQLWSYDEIEGRFRTVATLPAGASFAGLATTRRGDLIALLGDGSVRKYHVAGDGSVRLLNSANIPYQVHALAIDDASDDLFVLAADRRRLLRYTDANLLLPASDYPLPTPIVLDGEPSMSVDPTDNRLWITSEGSGAAFEIGRAATADAIFLASTVPLTSYPSPRSLRFDDRGVMTFVSGGVVRALKQNPTNGRYEPDPTAPLAGERASGFLEIGRSRTNHDPARHETRGWTDVIDYQDPSEVPVCPADFNGDSQVDFFDYLDFIATYDAGHMDADVNFDRTLDFFDYLDFVQAYDRGC